MANCVYLHDSSCINHFANKVLSLLLLYLTEKILKDENTGSELQC